MAFEIEVTRMDQAENAETTGTASFVWTVPEAERLPFLEGHFPGFPVVPGFFSVALAQKCLENWIGPDLSLLSEVVSAKFISPIQPREQIMIRVCRGAVAQLWDFEFTRLSGDLAEPEKLARILLKTQSDLGL